MLSWRGFVGPPEGDRSPIKCRLSWCGGTTAKTRVTAPDGDRFRWRPEFALPWRLIRSSRVTIAHLTKAAGDCRTHERLAVLSRNHPTPCTLEPSEGPDASKSSMLEDDSPVVQATPPFPGGLLW